MNGGLNPLLVDQCRVLFNESAEGTPHSLFKEKGGATGFPRVTLMNSTFKNSSSGLLGLNRVENMDLVKNVLLSTVDGDGIKPGDNIEFDLVEIYDTARGVGSHSDGYQWTGSPTDGVTGFNKINRNCIWMPSNDSINTMDTIGANNACLYFDPDWGPNSGEVAITEIHADRCFLNGGGFTFYVICESSGGYLTRDIKLTNSWFGLDYGFGFARDIATPGGISSDGDGISVWENNRRIDSGELIPKPNVS